MLLTETSSHPLLENWSRVCYPLVIILPNTWKKTKWAKNPETTPENHRQGKTATQNTPKKRNPRKERSLLAGMRRDSKSEVPVEQVPRSPPALVQLKAG